MIAKCQRSLVTTEPNGTQLLIYNRTREWIWSGDITPEWDDLFGLDHNRFFAEVQWQDGRTPPRFVRMMPEQDWPQRSGALTVAEGNLGDTTYIVNIR